MDDQSAQKKRNKTDPALRVSILSLVVSGLTFLLTFLDHGSVGAIVSFEGGSARYVNQMISTESETLHFTFLNSRNVPAAIFGISRELFGTTALDRIKSNSCPKDRLNTINLIDYQAPIGDGATIPLPARDTRSIDISFPKRDIATTAYSKSARYAVECLAVRFVSIGGRVSTFEFISSYYIVDNTAPERVDVRRIPKEVFDLSDTVFLAGFEFGWPQPANPRYTYLCADAILSDCEQNRLVETNRVQFDRELLLLPPT